MNQDLWNSMHPSVKVDCLTDVLSVIRTTLFQSIYGENALPDRCRHRIAFLNAQIVALDDIQDSMTNDDADRVARWLFDLARFQNTDAVPPSTARDERDESPALPSR